MFFWKDPSKNPIFGINVAILRADNSSQTRLTAETGPCSAHHSLRPFTIVHVHILMMKYALTFSTSFLGCCMIRTVHLIILLQLRSTCSCKTVINLLTDPEDNSQKVHDSRSSPLWIFLYLVWVSSGNWIAKI